MGIYLQGWKVAGHITSLAGTYTLLDGARGWRWPRRPIDGRGGMARMTGTLGWLGRGSLLLRFSLLSLAVLALIALGLGTILQREMERDALHQQADEIAVVVRGVLGPHLESTDVGDRSATRAMVMVGGPG